MTEPTDREPWPEKPPRKLPHLTQADLVSVLDEFGRTHWYMKEGRPVCGRLKKKHNRQIPDECCLGIPMQNGACRVHGGKAGRPIEHGRYSRALGKWRAPFVRALKDKDLLDTRRELAMMDTTIEQLLERMEELDSPGWRDEVQQTFQGLQAAVRGKRKGDVGAILTHLGELVDRGAGIDQIARDLIGHLDKRAARANKMEELALRKEEKVTVGEVGVLFGQWLGVLEKLLDQQTYWRVAEELRKVTGQHLPGVGVASDEGNEE